jgi:hypothetical protein
MTLLQQYQAAHGAAGGNMRKITVPPAQFDALDEAVSTQFPDLQIPAKSASGVAFAAESIEPKGNVTVYNSGKVVLTGALQSLVWPVPTP